MLGGNCREGWEYLSAAYDRWEWLSIIFEDELEYRTSLVAYYMALSIHELASTIDSGEQNTFKNVPLTFISEGQDINQRAVSLLIRNPEALTELWTCLTVTRELMENSWRDWIRSSAGWSLGVNKFSVDTRVYHQNLFELL